MIDRNTVRYVLLYVDDLLIISNNVEAIKTIKRELASEFKMTDVGPVESYLGIHVERIDDETMTLSQPHYLKNLLVKFDMQNCKPCATPMELGLHLPASNGVEESRSSESDDSEESNLPYRHLIGCLMHSTQTTRPDLCAATYYLSRFQNCYTTEHYTHAKRILRYVQGTQGLKLVYCRNPSAVVLYGYSDSDWGGDKNDYKSTSGYVFKVFGNTVSWLTTHSQFVVNRSGVHCFSRGIMRSKVVEKFIDRNGNRLYRANGDL